MKDSLFSPSFIGGAYQFSCGSDLGLGVRLAEVIAEKVSYGTHV